MHEWIEQAIKHYPAVTTEPKAWHDIIEVIGRIGAPYGGHPRVWKKFGPGAVVEIVWAAQRDDRVIVVGRFTESHAPRWFMGSMALAKMGGQLSRLFDPATNTVIAVPYHAAPECYIEPTVDQLYEHFTTDMLNDVELVTKLNIADFHNQGKSRGA